jgi:hypothetical protein
VSPVSIKLSLRRRTLNNSSNLTNSQQENQRRENNKSREVKQVKRCQAREKAITRKKSCQARENNKEEYVKRCPDMSRELRKIINQESDNQERSNRSRVGASR